MDNTTEISKFLENIESIAKSVKKDRLTRFINEMNRAAVDYLTPVEKLLTENKIVNSELYIAMSKCHFYEYTSSKIRDLSNVSREQMKAYFYSIIERYLIGNGVESLGDTSKDILSEYCRVTNTYPDVLCVAVADNYDISELMVLRNKSHKLRSTATNAKQFKSISKEVCEYVKSTGKNHIRVGLNHVFKITDFDTGALSAVHGIPDKDVIQPVDFIRQLSFWPGLSFKDTHRCHKPESVLELVTIALSDTNQYTDFRYKESLSGILIGKIEVDISRDVENRKDNTFDYITVSCGCPSTIDRSLLVDGIKKYRSDILSAMLDKVSESGAFKKFGIHVNFLECTDFILTRDRCVVAKFNLKE